ncbi:Hypothetical Protein PD5205_03530 [Xanthomonas fragariae]|uniref:Uncharacterized protein n=1 Tax=Xanthomonas fragariae TaxID=48664 RepID=A0A1Y6GWK9_9XANT|nr:DUF3606 domain-containing protein [Xanthomonas fragariae]ENZ96729.1 hypothetical protein O1K_02901 [Xanthomonas fragariae LMG 25863]AOD19534.1 DUF3606 domain-containing protein [Xanthomonas fragariae]MBL9197247.1 DUF3606 domain-containing protein [Xanthomonas fragariae]MBL9222195.1 DUF3606 domain-containing protein [Xanthomonas fragariae]
MHNVSINQEWQLQCWARELPISEDDLNNAVQKMGNLITTLRDYLTPH